MSALPQKQVSDEIAVLPQFLHGVHVKTAPVPRTLAGATADGVLWQAAPGRFLLRVPDVAVFLVQAGNMITLDPEPQAGATTIERFARMAPLAALFYQRGILAFHAAAVANSEGAILLAGDSGSGKSSLLVTLLGRGWSMLADELAALCPDDRGPSIPPTFSQIRLWRNAVEKLQPSSAWPSYDEGSWRIFSAAQQFSPTSQPLRVIYWLGVHNTDRIEQQELDGIDGFRAIGTLSHNSHIADALFSRTEYLRQAAVVAQMVPVRRLYRPRGKWMAEELADRIEGACA